jgi:hypothetical protein
MAEREDDPTPYRTRRRLRDLLRLCAEPDEHGNPCFRRGAHEPPHRAQVRNPDPEGRWFTVKEWR